MSEYELHSLITEHLRDMHGMVEFWVSATFAVIVARFTAGNYLTRGVLRVMTLLYLMATALSMTRYALLAYRYLEYQAALVRAGLSPFEQPAPLRLSMVVLVPSLYLCGTVAAVHFLRSRGSRGAGVIPGIQPN